MLKKCKVCDNKVPTNRRIYCSEICKKKALKIFYKERRNTTENKAYMKSYLKKWRDEHKDYHEDWKKKNPEYFKKWHEGHKRYFSKWARNNKDYFEKNKYKFIAQIIAGKIPIPKGQLCVDCNEKEAIHRHHEDYSKPLDVIYVCRRCHGKLERKKRRR